MWAQVESADDMHAFYSQVSKLLGRRAVPLDQPLGFISMCESATSLLNLR